MFYSIIPQKFFLKVKDPNHNFARFIVLLCAFGLFSYIYIKCNEIPSHRIVYDISSAKVPEGKILDVNCTINLNQTTNGICFDNFTFNNYFNLVHTTKKFKFLTSKDLSSVLTTEEMDSLEEYYNSNKKSPYSNFLYPTFEDYKKRLYSTTINMYFSTNGTNKEDIGVSGIGLNVVELSKDAIDSIPLYSSELNNVCRKKLSQFENKRMHLYRSTLLYTDSLEQFIMGSNGGEADKSSATLIFCPYDFSQSKLEIYVVSLNKMRPVDSLRINIKSEFACDYYTISDVPNYRTNNGISFDGKYAQRWNIPILLSMKAPDLQNMQNMRNNILLMLITLFFTLACKYGYNSFCLYILRHKTNILEIEKTGKYKIEITEE